MIFIREIYVIVRNAKGQSLFLLRHFSEKYPTMVSAFLPLEKLDEPIQDSPENEPILTGLAARLVEKTFGIPYFDPNNFQSHVVTHRFGINRMTFVTKELDEFKFRLNGSEYTSDQKTAVFYGDPSDSIRPVGFTFSDINSSKGAFTRDGHVISHEIVNMFLSAEDFFILHGTVTSRKVY